MEQFILYAVMAKDIIRCNTGLAAIQELAEDDPLVGDDQNGADLFFFGYLPDCG